MDPNLLALLMGQANGGQSGASAGNNLLGGTQPQQNGLLAGGAGDGSNGSVPDNPLQRLMLYARLMQLMRSPQQAPAISPSTAIPQPGAHPSLQAGQQSGGSPMNMLMLRAMMMGGLGANAS